MVLSSPHQIELVLGIFAVLLGTLAIVRNYWPCHPEFLRKAMHVGMGLVAFLLPWLFISNWSVVLLGGSVIALLMMIRLARPLRERLGGVIHDVDRKSWGETYFAIGVVGLFVLSHRESLLYGISILTLVLADTAASLIGCRHGFRRFHILGECKSVEGSLAFLMTAFVIGILGLWLFGSFRTLESLVLALAFALPVTLIEAVSGKGIDNFLVPLSTFALLKFLFMLSKLEMATFVAVMVMAVPVVFLFLYSRSHPESARGIQSSAARAKTRRQPNSLGGPATVRFQENCVMMIDTLSIAKSGDLYINLP